MKRAGTSFENVLKTTVYLTDMNDFDAFKTVYLLFFKDNNPANTLVVVGPTRSNVIQILYKTIQQVSKLPLGSLVELEAVAYVGEMETEYVDMDVDETNSQLTPKYVISDGN